MMVRVQKWFQCSSSLHSASCAARDAIRESQGLHEREAGDWHGVGPCRVALGGGTRVGGPACVWRLGSVRFVIFLSVSIIITTERLVCVDISPSVAVTQSEWQFYFFSVKSWIVNI